MKPQKIKPPRGYRLETHGIIRNGFLLHDPDSGEWIEALFTIDCKIEYVLSGDLFDAVARPIKPKGKTK